MQWTANITEHAHINDIKVPAHAGNNQNYYSQITSHLDRLDKCFHFDLTTYIEEIHHRVQVKDKGFEDDNKDNEDHEPGAEELCFIGYSDLMQPIIDYFLISSSLLWGSHPSAI